jgi:hypothetical protein
MSALSTRPTSISIEVLELPAGNFPHGKLGGVGHRVETLVEETALSALDAEPRKALQELDRHARKWHP